MKDKRIYIGIRHGLFKKQDNVLVGATYYFYKIDDTNFEVDLSGPDKCKLTGKIPEEYLSSGSGNDNELIDYICDRYLRIFRANTFYVCYHKVINSFKPCDDAIPCEIESNGSTYAGWKIENLDIERLLQIISEDTNTKRISLKLGEYDYPMIHLDPENYRN